MCSCLYCLQDNKLEVSLAVESAANTSDGRPVLPPGGNATVSFEVSYQGQPVEDAEVTVIAGTVCYC